MEPSVLEDVLGLSVSKNQWSALQFVLDEHVKWNKVYNLSAHRTFDDVWTYQLVDSLSVHQYIKRGSLLDVGTGPGFPGLPLAIIKPETTVTLLDSNDKKLAFARHIIHRLQLKNASTSHCRIEDLSSAEGFDQIISRAFTDLSGMITCAAPLLTSKGVLLAMKGSRAEEEMTEATQQHPEFTMTKIALPHLVKEQRVLVQVSRDLS